MLDFCSQKLEQEGEQDGESEPLNVHEAKSRADDREIVLEGFVDLIVDDIVDGPQAEDDGGVDPKRPIAALTHSYKSYSCSRGSKNPPLQNCNPIIIRFTTSLLVTLK